MMEAKLGNTVSFSYRHDANIELTGVVVAVNQNTIAVDITQAANFDSTTMHDRQTVKHGNYKVMDVDSTFENVKTMKGTDFFKSGEVTSLKTDKLNGLTVEIYHELIKKGFTNDAIQRKYNLNNVVYYNWKKEMGLTRKADDKPKRNETTSGTKKEAQLPYGGHPQTPKPGLTSPPKEQEQITSDTNKAGEFEEEINLLRDKVARLTQQVNTEHEMYVMTKQAVAESEERRKAAEAKCKELELIANDAQLTLERQDQEIHHYMRSQESELNTVGFLTAETHLDVVGLFTTYEETMFKRLLSLIDKQ